MAEVGRALPMRATALGMGIASGLFSASILTVWQIDDVPAPRVLGYCVGMRISSFCQGVDAAFYLFPGLSFGAFLAAWERWQTRINFGHLLAFTIASGVANAVAVFLCVWLTDRLPRSAEH